MNVVGLHISGLTVLIMGLLIIGTLNACGASLSPIPNGHLYTGSSSQAHRHVRATSTCSNQLTDGCASPGTHANSNVHPLFLEAKERNEGEAFRREMRRRQTIAEGVFQSQDRLGWARSRLRGLRKVDCEGYLSALAHNLKKAVRRMGDFVDPRAGRWTRTCW